MCFHYGGRGVCVQGEVVRDVNSKKCKTLDEFHTVSINDDRLMFSAALPEV